MAGGVHRHDLCARSKAIDVLAGHHEEFVAIEADTTSASTEPPPGVAMRQAEPRRELEPCGLHDQAIDAGEASRNRVRLAALKCLAAVGEIVLVSGRLHSSSGKPDAGCRRVRRRRVASGFPAWHLRANCRLRQCSRRVAAPGRPGCDGPHGRDLLADLYAHQLRIVGMQIDRGVLVRQKAAMLRVRRSEWPRAAGVRFHARLGAPTPGSAPVVRRRPRLHADDGFVELLHQGRELLCFGQRDLLAFVEADAIALFACLLIDLLDLVCRRQLDRRLRRDFCNGFRLRWGRAAAGAGGGRRAWAGRSSPFPSAPRRSFPPVVLEYRSCRVRMQPP